MSNLKLYTSKDGFKNGGTVRCDDKLYVAVTAEILKQSHPSYAAYVRSLLAAVCLDKTYGDISQQGQLIAKNTYYTESDIRVYESQIETLKNQFADCVAELKSRDISYQNSREQDQSEIARLKAQNQHQNQNQNKNQESLNPARNQMIQQNQNQNQESLNPARNQMIQQNQNQNQNQNQSWEEFVDSAKFQPPQTQPPTQLQAGTNLFQAGLDLSERGTNQPVPEVVQVDMVELINENFLEVVGNQLVIEYFNQQNKLNQSFGISGFSGTFKVVEEIPNSLLEHHPLVVYWKKQVGQFENAVVNATEAFFEKDNAVKQMTRNEQLALVALTKREQMLWWLITHFTTIRGFEIKYYQFLLDTVRIQCQGFPAMPNPYHQDIINAQNQPQYGAGITIWA